MQSGLSIWVLSKVPVINRLQNPVRKLPVLYDIRHLIESMTETRKAPAFHHLRGNP